MEKLTVDVEEELESRLRDLDTKLEDANAQLDRISPRVNDLRQGLYDVERIVSQVITRRAEVSRTLVVGSWTF